MSSAPSGAGASPPARDGADSAITRTILPALILAVAAALRFFAIDHSSFWSDEGNTWALVQRSWGEIAAAAAIDIHPPGFYWLLKGWTALFGLSEASLRSFSAACGVLLVGAVLLIGRHVARRDADTGARRWLPLGAAWVAALLPFQIFYSQEARMYMLLALLAALLFLLVLRLLPSAPAVRRPLLIAGAYALTAAAGLWTHYSFPIVIAAAALAWFIDWLRTSPRSGRAFALFAAANAAALLLFTPWIGTAWRQVTSWPQGGDAVGLLEGGRLIVHTLLFGLMRATPQPAWPWLAGALLLPVAGAWALRRNRTLPALLLWLGAPILLMAVLGLFTPAFLKFLLVASAPWCVLVAAAAEAPSARLRPLARGLLAGAVLLLALLTLPAYYADPQARDNYKGVAAWLAASADPAQEIVLLNAPGQADVWSLYDPGLPTVALPAERPADATSVARILEAATRDKRVVHALLWATDESDPNGLVESWLAKHFYRGAESWQGNLRVAAYVRPPEMRCVPVEPGPAPLALTEACTPRPAAEAGGGSVVEAGAPLAVALRWESSGAPSAELAASVQLLDGRNQVVAQHDGPAVQSPAEQRASGETPPEGPLDRRALVVPHGTPPGEYRLVVALYDPATGARLPLAGTTDAPVELADVATVTVTRAERPLPTELLPVAERTDRALGPVRLAGYTQHKAGFAHAPDTPLAAGDLLHLTLFWQAPQPLPADWPADATFTVTLADQAVTLPLAGGGWPTSAWQAGDIARVEVDIPVSPAGVGARPVVAVAGESLRLQRAPR